MNGGFFSRIKYEAWTRSSRFIGIESGFEIVESVLRENFLRLRKFYQRSLPFSCKCFGLFSRQDAKNAKFGIIFFPLRPLRLCASHSDSVAALPR